jgi:hypothetical protein
MAELFVVASAGYRDGVEIVRCCISDIAAVGAGMMAVSILGVDN